MVIFSISMGLTGEGHCRWSWLFSRFSRSLLPELDYRVFLQLALNRLFSRESPISVGRMSQFLSAFFPNSFYAFHNCPVL